MRLKPKNFFFLLILIGFFLPVVSQGNAETEHSWQWVTIDNTWLSVSVGDFIDSTRDGTGEFHVSKGGYSLLSFENDGKISEDGNVISWRARAEFKFEINFFTTVDIKDVFPYSNLESKKSFPYADIFKFKSVWFGKYGGSQWIYPSIEFNEVDFGSKFNAHDYDGIIPITVSIHPDWISQESVELNGVEFKNPTLKAEIKKIVVAETRTDFLADYENIYLGMETVSGGLHFDNPTKDLDEVEGDCFTAINKYNLGWNLASEDYGITYKEGVTGQSWYEAKEEGSWFDNYQSTDSFSIKLPARIKPEVTYDKQTINTRWAEIYWDYEDLIFSESYAKITQGPVERPYDRITGVHVQNRFIHQEFIVIVNFITTAEMIPDEKDSDLADPFVDAGDMIWDVDIGGDTDTTLVYDTPFQDWLSDFIQFWNDLGLGFMAWVIPILTLIGIGGIIFISLPYTNDKIAEEYEFDQSNVTRIVDRVEGYINSKLGLYYEEYYCQKLQESGEYDSVERFGGLSEPDVVAIKGKQLFVFSLKCLNFSRKSYSIPIKEFQPEINYAKKNLKKYTKITVTGNIFNRYDMIEYEKKIDIENPPRTVLIKRLKK